eukprot:1978609-Prymnesium_polylepis.1
MLILAWPTGYSIRIVRGQRGGVTDHVRVSISLLFCAAALTQCSDRTAMHTPRGARGSARCTTRR